MIIGVTFGARANPFGKEYSYRLAKGVPTPKVGSVIRMMDEDYNFIHNGTRTRIVNVRKATEKDVGLKVIRYINATMERD